MLFPCLKPDEIRKSSCDVATWNERNGGCHEKNEKLYKYLESGKGAVWVAGYNAADTAYFFANGVADCFGGVCRVGVEQIAAVVQFRQFSAQMVCDSSCDYVVYV